MYDSEPPPRDREAIAIENKIRLVVEFVGSVDIVFVDTRMSVPATGVSFIPRLGLNLYSVYAASWINLVISDSLGFHLIGKKGISPQSTSGFICI